MGEKTVEERAKKLVDPRRFTVYGDYLLALAQKERELLLSDAQIERIRQEKESKRIRRRNEIRREIDEQIGRGSGGQVTGHTTDKQAEAELERREQEERGMEDMYH